MTRRRKRRISYRPARRRTLRMVRAALAAVAVVALALALQTALRSLRTARLNRQLVAMHTADGQPPAVEVAAPALETDSDTGVESTLNTIPGAGRAALAQEAPGVLTLSMMGLPDGSPIEPAVLAPVAFHANSGDVLPDMLKLLKTNPDTVGWINIPGIVRLPVVYRDNEYYLTHDFNGHHNTSGTLFLDQGSPITAQTQNLLIHGHSMHDGSMFGLLTHYRRLDTLLQHPLIGFSTLYERETYAVFAVLNVDPDAFHYYTHAFFASNADFDAYIASVRARSLYDIPIDVQPTDALLTLSTCIDDDRWERTLRLVVIARKMRTGETKDELVSAAEQSSRV